MKDRCPHLGRIDHSQPGMGRRATGHPLCFLCYSEPPAGAYLAGVCLTAGYKTCPRLAGRSPMGGVGVLAGTGPSLLDSRRRTWAPADVSPLSRWPGRVARTRRPPVTTAPRPTGETGQESPAGRRPLCLANILSLAFQVSVIFAVLCIALCFVCRPSIFADVGPQPVLEEALPPLGSTEQTSMGRTGGPGPAVADPGLWPTPVPMHRPTEPIEVAAVQPIAAQPTPLPTSPGMVARASPPAAVPTAALARRPANAPPTRLRIPRIGLDVPIRPVGTKVVSEGLIWDTLPDVAGFHETSAYPGQPGNTVINGHRDVGAAVFRPLGQVKVGDEIELFVENGVYVYRVARRLVVPHTHASAQQHAENRRLIGSLPEERLTLITCTPIGSATHRLLIIARPVAGLEGRAVP